MSNPRAQQKAGCATPTAFEEKKAGIGSKYDNAELLWLLGVYEAELQARDVALSILKAEKARKTHSSGEEVELELLRDSAVLVNKEAGGSYSTNAHSPYQSQLNQLENMVRVQRTCNKRVNQTLNALEKRHAKILYEVNLQKERAQNNSLKSDEFFLLIENERSKFQSQLDQKDEEIKNLEKELEKNGRTFAEEKEREKIMILYLINERKQLLLKLNEMRMRLNTKNDVEDSPLVHELKKQVSALNGECESLSNLVKSLQSEKDNLQKKVGHLEGDLLLIQQNILHETREQSESLSRNNRVDGLILANKGAFATEKQQFHQHHTYSHHNPQHAQQPASSQHIQSSASFPSAQYAPSNNLAHAKHHHPPPSTQPVTPLHAQPQKTSASLPYTEKVFPTVASTLSSDQQNYANSKIGNSSTTTNSSNLRHTNSEIAPSNHSTVLLHRPSGRPPLGIKASNLPLSRTLQQQQQGPYGLGIHGPIPQPSYRQSSSASGGNSGDSGLAHGDRRNNNTSAGRRSIPSPQLPTSTSFPSSNQLIIPSSQQQHMNYHPQEQHVEYVILDSRNSKALTKRSSSLPRNVIQNAQLNFHNTRNNNLHNS